MSRAIFCKQSVRPAHGPDVTDSHVEPGVDALKGVGHFTLWFSAGWGAFFALRRWRPSPHVEIFGPFLPFVTGTVGALPYALMSMGTVEPAGAVSPMLNVFLFYGWVNEVSVLVRLFSHFHLNMVLLALLYSMLLLHYNRLVRRLRRLHAQ